LRPLRNVFALFRRIPARAILLHAIAGFRLHGDLEGLVRPTDDGYRIDARGDPSRSILR
jgi:hypothetical protein